MLTQDDLKAIGQVINETVPGIIKELVPPMIAAGVDDLELRMNVKFDALHESFERLENTVVTKSYLDDRLAHYVRKPSAA